MRTMLASLCALGLLVGCERRNDQETAADLPQSRSDTAGTAMAAGDTAAAETGLNWGPAPPFLPAGARAAVVEGDPAKPGPFVIQLEAPDGYEIRPHHHRMAENVRVVEGTFMLGRGKEWADNKLKPLAVGDESSIAAKEPHYARTKGKTIVEIKSTGPFEITYENPADDPRKTTIQ